MIISIQDPKGGTGKSTTSLFISNFLAYKCGGKEQYKKILLVDADDQGTLMGIIAEQESQGVDLGKSYDVEAFVSQSPSKWKEFLSNRMDKYDTIVIDCAGNFGGVERSFISRASNLIVVPTIAQRGVLLTTVEFLNDLMVDIDPDRTKVVTVANFARNTKEQEQIGIIEKIEGVKLLGSLPMKVAYSRHRNTTKHFEDQSLNELMKSLKKYL